MPELDHNQRAAVEAGAADLFIEAGAGSGKTGVLTERFVAAVMGDTPYAPSEPRALPTVTFTEKAAGEVAERIRRRLAARGAAEAARALGDAWISTIHGMCARILKQHAFAASLDPQFSVLDQVEASALEAEALASAVGDLVGSDERVTTLIDLYGYDTVVGALSSISASVRALGLSAEEVETLPREEALRRLERCAEELTDLASALDELRQTSTVAANAAAVRGFAARIREATGQAHDEPERLLGDLADKGMRKAASVEGHDELLGAVRETLSVARAAAAQLAVGDLEEALLALAAAFELQYDHLKHRRGALDFTDLEVRAMRLLESHPEIAGAYRERFAMLMVDEFQDTNRLQARIVGQLASGNLCTVGDENQSIYRFRHADVEVFRERGAQAAARQRLDINYRTAPPLLDDTNRLFANPALLGSSFGGLRPSPERVGVERDYGGGSRFEMRFIDWETPGGRDPHEVEAECIADRVAELVAAGVAPGSIAVLMRALARGRGTKVERALLARGVPAHLSSGGAFFSCREVTEARSLLQVIDNVWDDGAMATVLAGSLCALSADGLVHLREHADSLARDAGRSRRDAHLWDAMTSPGLALADADALAVARLVSAVGEARGSRGTSPLGDTLHRALLDLDADLVCFAAGRGGERAWANLAKLVRLATEYETITGGSIGGFLSYLDLRELHSTGEQEATLDGASDAVRIMSIHAAKGLEFDVVLLGGLDGGGGVPGITMERLDGRPLLGMVLRTAEGTQPTLASEMVRSAAAAASAAEAVRLLYVGCTRARESLTIVARTDPAKDADDSLVGRLRRALGVGSGGALTLAGAAAFDGLGRVTLVDARVSSLSAGSGVPAGDPAPVPPAVEPECAAFAPAGDEGAVRPPAPGASPAQVSYSGLATYERCPYRFFLSSVMHLPAPPAAQGGGALAFGSAVHSVLERLRDANEDPGPLIDAAASAARLERASVRRLREAVEAYRSSPAAAEVFAAERVMREAPIAVPIGDTVLAGAIDAIAWHGEAALIVDYKTGTAPLSAAEAVERYRLQGACYAIAAFAAGAASVRVVFMELERGRETAYVYALEDREHLEADVLRILRRMAEEGYPPRETFERELCETCPGLGGMCPVTRPSRDGAV